MSSGFYIPPPGLRFRLVGYASQWAIFSRNTSDSPVGHHPASQEYPDQWFTLLHGSGNHAGLYAVKSQVTGNVLFSRSQSTRVGHIGGDGKYEDKSIEPDSGQYTNYFRLITPSDGLTLFSRLSPNALGNHPENDFHADQLFGFFWEDMKVDKIEYNLDAGKVISSTLITLAEQVLTNNTASEQEMSFNVNKGVTNSSTFEYST
ncbi:hypothetical protein BDM02DRAFT_3186671, partial [Thelephora ganbajun]